MFVVQTILHFPCAFCIYLFFLMITCCVRVGGSSTLGSGTGSGLWVLVPGVILALQDWGWGCQGYDVDPSVYPGRQSSCNSLPGAFICGFPDDHSHVLNHIHTHAKV